MTLDSEDAARRWFAEELNCGRIAMDRLEMLQALLVAENCRQNLVSAGSLVHVWVRHFADSAQLLNVSRGTQGRWLDLGAGAGFPGLVVAICAPERDMMLVESRTRRAAWLRQAVAALDLRHVEVAECRLERQPSGAMGIISARAFAPLDRTIELAIRFSTRETLWLLPKGRNGRNELAMLPKTVRSMFHVKQSLTDLDSVVLIGRGIEPLGAAR